MIKRFIPTRESIKQHRLLRWLGPRLHDPSLWRLNRHTVAKAVAIGAFFGVMIPVAQIPAAVIASLTLRANLLVASLSTLISNPFTYAPLYYFAYRLGTSLLGVQPTPEAAKPPVVEGSALWFDQLVQWFNGVGQPLLLGMTVMAVSAAVLGYGFTLAIWRLNVMRKRWQRAQIRPGK